MKKLKRQLRAEAVERLKNAQTDNLDWMLLGDECPSWVNYDTLSYNKVVRERVADLLTDDEIPEGDVASILRKAASYDGDYSSSSEALRRLTDATTVYYALEKLADMVERDYVLRDDFNKMRERHRKERVYWHNEMHAVLDTLNGKERFWGACMEYPLDEYSLSPSEIAKQTLERDYVRREEYVALGKSLGLTQAKCDGLSRKFADSKRSIDELKAEIVSLVQNKQPYTFNPEAPIENIRTACRYIDELTAERDEWKAKAEACNPCGWWNASLQYCECNDDLPSKNDVSANDVDVNDANAAQDSRERLEAEIRYEYSGAIAHEAEEIIGWLNRQAAITEREVLCHPDERDEQIAELQAELEKRDKGINRLKRRRDELGQQVSTMTAEIVAYKATTDRLVASCDELKQKLEASHEEHDFQADACVDDEVAALKRELKMARGELSVTLNNWEQAKGKLRRQEKALAERRKALDDRDAKAVSEIADEWMDRMQAKFERAEAERDELREKLSRAIDCAHEITMLTDMECC